MRKKHLDESVISFAEADITNILELFHVLSDGTHGAAGRYEFQKLMQVKKRVEQGINFLCEVSEIDYRKLSQKIVFMWTTHEKP